MTYMLAGLVFPDLFGEGIVDLRESFYAHRVWFFVLGFLVILVSIGKAVVLYGEFPHPTDLAFHAFFGTIFPVGALTRRESCLKALVVLAMASFILISLLSLRDFISSREGVAISARSFAASQQLAHLRRIWIADAHHDNGKRFVARADEKLTVFLELQPDQRFGDCIDNW